MSNFSNVLYFPITKQVNVCFSDQILKMLRPKDDIWRKFNKIILPNGKIRAQCKLCKDITVGLVSRMKTHFDQCHLYPNLPKLVPVLQMKVQLQKNQHQQRFPSNLPFSLSHWHASPDMRSTCK